MAVLPDRTTELLATRDGDDWIRLDIPGRASPYLRSPVCAEVLPMAVVAGIQDEAGDIILWIGEPPPGQVLRLRF